MAKFIIDVPAIIAPREEKILGPCGPWLDTKKKNIAKNVNIHQNMQNSLTYFTLTEI
jgi:hypothetical protein